MRNSLATKDFSKIVWNDILHKWYKIIKQHLERALNLHAEQVLFHSPLLEYSNYFDLSAYLYA